MVPIFTALVNPGLKNLAFIFLNVFIVPKWLPSLWTWFMASLTNPWVKIILPLADNILLVDHQWGTVLLLIALTVSAVPRFSLFIDSRVGAPYQSVSSISADEWQPIYNWANTMILSFSLGTYLGDHAFSTFLWFSLLGSLRWLLQPVALQGKHTKGILHHSV